MLKWFLDSDIATEVQKTKTLVHEEQVEARPELLPDALLDENIDVHLIRRFFTDDAWLLLEEVVSQKLKRNIYTCKHCSHDVHESPSVACDHCLNWFHMSCIGLKKGPKHTYWFCRQCHASPMC